MKKIRLDVDGLKVESFDVAGEEAARAGSVHAYETVNDTCRNCQATDGPSFCPDNCSYFGPVDTCAYSCASEPCVCVPQG